MEPITPTSKTHVIISGGAGFIGSHLSARLLRGGTRVTILTRHADAPRAVQLAKQGATIIPCDFASSDRIPSLSALSSAQVFYHLAADVSVSSPTLWASNVEGTARALALADKLKVPYCVFASSIEAQGLGSDQDIPLGEEAPCRPVSDYGASKARAEDLVARWGRSDDHQALILRIGNIYGPGSAWLLQPSLLALLGAGPLRHAWPLLQHRLFQPLYIDDLVEGILRAVSQRLTGLYNITGEEPVTVGTYLQKLASLTGLTTQFEAIRTPPDTQERPAVALAPDFAYILMGTPDRCHRSYDNAKLRAEIGDYARWSLARGLAATLNWYHTSGALPALTHAIRRRRGAYACMSH